MLLPGDSNAAACKQPCRLKLAWFENREMTIFHYSLAEAR